MLTRFIFSTLLFTLPLPLLARDLNETETNTLLSNIASANKGRASLQTDFKEVKTLKLVRDPIVSEGTLWLKLPNQFKKEQRSGSGSTYICDGKEFWIYYPVFKKAECYPLGHEKKIDESLAAVTAGFDLVQLKEIYNVSASEEANGWKLQLVPRKSSLRRNMKELVLSLSKEFEIESANVSLPKDGKLLTTFRNHKHGAISDSVFKFNPPLGTEITRPLDRTSR